MTLLQDGIRVAQMEQVNMLSQWQSEGLIGSVVRGVQSIFVDGGIGMAGQLIRGPVKPAKGSYGVLGKSSTEMGVGCGRFFRTVSRGNHKHRSLKDRRMVTIEGK